MIPKKMLTTTTGCICLKGFNQPIPNKISRKNTLKCRCCSAWLKVNVVVHNLQTRYCDWRYRGLETVSEVIGYRWNLWHVWSGKSLRTASYSGGNLRIQMTLKRSDCHMPLCFMATVCPRKGRWFTCQFVFWWKLFRSNLPMKFGIWQGLCLVVRMVILDKDK